MSRNFVLSICFRTSLIASSSSALSFTLKEAMLARNPAAAIFFFKASRYSGVELDLTKESAPAAVSSPVIL